MSETAETAEELYAKINSIIHNYKTWVEETGNKKYELTIYSFRSYLDTLDKTNINAIKTAYNSLVEFMNLNMPDDFIVKYMPKAEPYNGGRRRKSASSSHHHRRRRSSKKRATQRKQKRRQRRASRRAY
jgi:hypothetical protein